MFFVFLFGLCLGSFANVVSIRYGQNRDWIYSPSCCCNCGKALRFLQNIPLYGWLRNCGYSSCCNRPIPIRYIIVEILAAGLLVLLFKRLELLVAFTFLPFYIICLIIFLTDLDHFIIPNTLTIGGLILGLVFSLLGMPEMPSFLMSLVGAFSGLVLMVGIMMLYRFWRGIDGLGMGDIKLMAMFGAWFGPFVLFLYYLWQVLWVQYLVLYGFYTQRRI